MRGKIHNVAADPGLAANALAISRGSPDRARSLGIGTDVLVRLGQNPCRRPTANPDRRELVHKLVDHANAVRTAFEHADHSRRFATRAASPRAVTQ